MEIVKPRLDIVFKMMFSDKNNEDLLIDLVASLLGIDKKNVKNLTIKNPEISPEELDMKYIRLDLNLSIDGKLVNIEIQICGHKSFRERIFYYWANLYGNQLMSGEQYTSIKETVAIAITDFRLFDTDDYHSVYTMYDVEHGERLTDKCAIHFFELPKIKDEDYGTDDQLVWLRFLKADKEDDLKMMANVDNPAVQKAIRVIYDYSSDDAMRAQAERRERALRLESTMLSSAREEGFNSGFDSGVANVYAALRDMGYDESVIAQLTSMLNKPAEM